MSPKALGFPLKREAARIPGIAGANDQFAIEYLLSASIVLRKRNQHDAPSTVKYDIVVWLDYVTDFNSKLNRGSILSMSPGKADIDLHLEDCGIGGLGFFQFLTVAARVIDQWGKCWDTMMDTIDSIISVQVC